VSIAPSPHDQPVNGGTTVPFRKQFADQGVQPTMDLRVNVPRAVATSGLPDRALSLAAFLRDPATKRYRVLAQWQIARVPHSWAAEMPIRISPRAEIGVLLYLNRARKPDAATAYRFGSVLEKASIKIVPETQPVTFPVRPVPPSEFAKFDLPPETVWAVHFKNEQVDAPPADVIEVLVNEKQVNRLAASFARPDGRTVAAALAAAIYSAIARGTLTRAKLPPQDPEGLLAKIHGRFQARAPIEDNQLLLYAQDPRAPFVEAVSQVVVDLYKRI
jgi:hypothetical protein